MSSISYYLASANKHGLTYLHDLNPLTRRFDLRNDPESRILDSLCFIELARKVRGQGIMDRELNF